MRTKDTEGSALNSTGMGEFQRWPAREQSDSNMLDERVRNEDEGPGCLGPQGSERREERLGWLVRRQE